MGHTYASEDSFSAEMQNILHIANRLKEVTSSSNSSIPASFTSCHPFAFDSISLPVACPLLPTLLDAGVDRELAIAVNKLYELRAEELRKHIQESIVTAAHEITELPTAPFAPTPDLLIGKILSTASEVYLQRLGQWKEDVVKRIEQASKPTANVVASKNPRAFNYAYVPLLEHFFGENPFPTHADKMFLAKKSNMEYRQIHVWFQNRRNRTRKEGKQLRKNTTHVAPVKPLYQSVKGRMADPQVPKTFEVLSECANEPEKYMQTSVPNDTFPSSSPPHAFPSPYPPVCLYDPFPCKTGPVHFRKPEWRRLPCRKAPLLPSTTTRIDELVDKFSQLNVRDETRFKGPPRSLLDSCAATSAITVMPSRAPHPSLLLCESRQGTNIVQRYPIVRAGTSSSNVFRGFGPISKPATLVPPSVLPDEGNLPGKRKTAPLPRRFHGRMCNTSSRNTSPSESSPIACPSPYLFSSDIETRSCSLSTVGSLSTLSDVASSQGLLQSSGSSYCSLFDSPTYLHDIAAITVPPVS